jgi:hypothetical protein
VISRLLQRWPLLSEAILSAFFLLVQNPIESQLLPMALPADHFRSMHHAPSDQDGLAAPADATSLGMPKKNRVEKHPLPLPPAARKIKLKRKKNDKQE